MTMFVIQSALLLAVALIIGCAVGYVLRMLIAPAAPATGKASQRTGTSEKIASVPPADALIGAPIPPPTRILDETKQIKDRGGRKSPAAKPQSAKSRTAATKSRPAAKKKATASPAAKKKAAVSKSSAAPEKDQGRPKSIAKPAKPDELTDISGIGPKIAEKLNGLGVYRWSQIADWKKAERDWVNAHLSFKGRIEREDWIRQAKALAKGKSGK